MRDSGAAGFTLLELLISMVILGLVVAIAIGKFKDVRVKAYDAAAIEEIRQLVNMSEAHFADHSEYPDDVDDLVDYTPSEGIEITRFNREVTDGVNVVHIHLNHQSSPHYFHVEYPVQQIEKRDR